VPDKTSKSDPRFTRMGPPRESADAASGGWRKGWTFWGYHFHSDGLSAAAEVGSELSGTGASTY